MGVTAFKETTQTLQKLSSIFNIDQYVGVVNFIQIPGFEFNEFPKPFDLGPYGSDEVHVVIVRQTLTPYYSLQRQAFDKAFEEKISSLFDGTDLKYKRTSSLLKNIMFEEFKVQTPTQLTDVIVRFGIANKYATEQVGSNHTFIQTVVLGSSFVSLKTQLENINTSWSNLSSDVQDGWIGIITPAEWDRSLDNGYNLVLNLLVHGISDNIYYVMLKPDHITRAIV